MKRFYQCLIIAFLLPISMASFAAEEPATPQHEAHAQPHKEMGMMDEEHLKAMQEHILAMHDLSNQILAEKDPAKKEQLKQQQRDLMKSHHASMMGHTPKMQH
ncbi:hypothetical protein DOJK_00410 [Patescibacteria group bacterium]|nr:hypothetical protein DOJK_00410 [Patescibacteria group bacterium]